MNKLRQLPLDQRGDIMVNTLLSVLVFVLLLMTFVNMAGVFTTYQSLSYHTKNIARTVELEGGVTDAVQARINVAHADLQSEFCNGLTTVNATEMVDANYYSGSQIQLRDSFTVTGRCVYQVPILTPAFGAAPVTLDIPLAVTIQGMSEVYWKAGT